MLGRSWEMTKSGVSFLQLKMKEAPKGVSLRMVHIQHALKQMKPIVYVVADEGTTRPTGVKAAKARGKKPMVDAKELSQF